MSGTKWDHTLSYNLATHKIWDWPSWILGLKANFSVLSVCMCVCGCCSCWRVPSTWCHLYFLSLLDTAIWASVCSSRPHLRLSLPLFPSHTLSSFGRHAHTHTLHRDPNYYSIELYAICLRRYGQVSDKNPHARISYHPEPTAILSWALPVCMCVHTLSSVSKWPVHNAPPHVNQLSSQSGDLTNPKHNHGKKPTECMSVCASGLVWQCVE